MEQSPSWDASSHSASQEIICLLWSRGRFIAVFTRPYPWSLFWAICIQSTPSGSNSLRSSVMLSTHLPLGLLIDLFHSGFPTKLFYALLMIPVRATRTTHLILLDSIIPITSGETHKLRSSSLCSLLQPHATFSLLGQNILITLFPNTLNICSSLNVRDQVSHPYKAGKVMSFIFTSLKT